MSKNIRTQLGKVIGKSLNSYHARVKPIIDDIKFKEQYQGRIIDCMVGEVDDNYIETPETDAPIVKLEHSKEGLVKVPSIKGKTILVDVDGNETDTPAEGCRLVSVGEEEDNKMIILSKNKNLIDITKDYFLSGDVKSPTIKDNQLTIESRFTCSVQYCIKLKKDTRYRLSLKKIGGTENSAIIRIGKYLPTDGNILGSTYSSEYIQNGFYSKTFVNKEDLCVISLMPNSGSTYTNVILEDIQVEELSSDGNDIHYISHKSHKTEILLDEPLIKINNKVYDEIVGNKLIRRIGKIVLDGSDDNRLIPSTHGSENFTFYIGTHGLATSNSATNIISNNFPTLHQAWSNTQEGISIFSNKTIWITIRNSKLQTADLEGAKQWLKENPTTIYYELAEPIIEELPNGITLQGFDDTTMYIENTITPTVSYGYNALIPYKEELSKQKEEVETNTLDIENNIIPYLMDMEFNLMLMEDNE